MIVRCWTNDALRGFCRFIRRDGTSRRSLSFRNGWAEGERTRRVARGEPLPRGVRLEEFREGELVSVFVHPFRPDVASVADRVREIFRGNADARPLRLPGEQGESTKDTK